MYPSTETASALKGGRAFACDQHRDDLDFAATHPGACKSWLGARAARRRLAGTLVVAQRGHR
jgi:hypothetical protein